jgi:hypothetical protein
MSETPQAEFLTSKATTARSEIGHSIRPMLILTHG